MAFGHEKHIRGNEPNELSPQAGVQSSLYRAPRRARPYSTWRASVAALALVLAGASIPSAVLAEPVQPQVSSSGSTYHALTPTRILDTRSGTGLAGAFSSHVARTFGVIGGNGGVPAGATAVTGNLTVTAQTSGGFLFIGPAGTNNPTSSALNFPLGDDRASGVTVALSGAGTLSVTYAAPSPGATAQVLFDVTGYFTPDSSGSTYHALTPTRILDTRSGTGLAGAFSSHVARTFGVIGGNGGVPAGATAVTGNLTVTAQTSGGFLFIGPAGTNNPTSSALNFPLGDDRASGVTVALSGAGTLSVTYAAPSPGATAQVLFDVTGYFTPDSSGSTYHALTPTRILDTRSGTGLAGAFSSHVARTFGVIGGNGGVPAGATAVTGNLTVTAQTSGGFLFIGPAGTNNPTSSALNFPLGDDRASGVTVALSGAGTLSVTYAAPSPGATAQVLFDVTGYFSGGSPAGWLTVVDDEFDSAGLSSWWRSYDGPYGSGAGNCAVPSHAVVSGGYLHLIMSYETSSSLPCGAGWYTAGLVLNGYSSIDQRVTVRFRVVDSGVAGHFIIPMRWPDNGGWPAAGEEDYCETDTATACMTFLHYSAANQQNWHSYTVDMTQWHTFRFQRLNHVVSTFIDNMTTPVWTFAGDSSTLPDTLKHVVLQQECQSSCPVGTAGSEDIQIDWITVENPG